MLDAIIRWSLRYRTLVVVLALATMLCGGYLSATLPIDVFPDLDRPRVVILTECRGLSPEEVETLVTQPIESRLLGATGVQAVRSQSSIGLNVVYVEFAWNTEIRAARQVVQERLASLAGKLRLSPSSRYDAQHAHVLHSRGSRYAPRPWEPRSTFARNGKRPS